MKWVRLYTKTNLIKPNCTLEINDNDFNYLVNVMRKKINDKLLVFNGFEGEWLAKITQINKKNCQLQIIHQTKPQYFPPSITLAFAPVKNVRIDFIAAKATELGITKFQPIITAHTIVDKINLEKFTANIKEAAEQCERLDLPEIHQPIKLSAFLKNLQENQILILCDESGNGEKASKVLSSISKISNQEIIIFTGPEGGFSKTEFEEFNKVTNLYKISLGSRILRADTAIIAATTLVQEFLGDFHLKPNKIY
jgi:16S rRNA (uracil1498-N3)-methyltransferase